MELYPPNLGGSDRIQEPRYPISLLSSNGLPKIFYKVEGKKGKSSIEISEQNKQTISNLLSKLIDYFYNTYCLSKGLESLNKIIQSVEYHLEQSNQDLHAKQLEVTQKITQVNEDLQNYETIYKSKSQLNPEDFGRVKIETFTDIGNIKEEAENRLIFEREMMEISKNIEFSKEFLILLEAKSNKLYSEAFVFLGDMLEDMRKVREFYQGAKTLEDKLISIKSINQLIACPILLEKVAGHMSSLRTIENYLNRILHKNIHFRLSLRDLENHPNLYNQLISQYKILSVQKTMELVYYQDYENILTLKHLHSQQVKDYSAIWLLKHFQKNIRLLTEETFKLYDYFDRLQLKTIRDFESGVNKIELLENHLPDIRPVKFPKYKSDLMTEKSQELIKENIEILHSNLEKLFDMARSLTIIKNSTITFKQLPLEPVKQDLRLKESMSKELKLISSKILQIEKSFFEISSSLKTFRILTSEGVTVAPRITISQDRIDQDMSFQVTRQVQRGIVSAVLMTPKFSHISFSQLLKFPNHENFKGLRSAQSQNLSRMKIIEEKLDFTKKVMEKISQLQSELLNVQASVSTADKFESINLEELEKNWLMPVFTEKIMIEKKNLFAAFGAIFQSINFCKSGPFVKTDPPSIRTKITASLFFEAFIDGIRLRAGENSVSSFKNLFAKKELAVWSFLVGLVDERIVGSFLDDSHSTQQIRNGLVEENWESSIIEICECLAFLALVQNKKNASDLDWLKRIDNLEAMFFKVLREFDKSLLKKLERV